MNKQNQLFLIGEENELYENITAHLPAYELLHISVENWSEDLRRYDPTIIVVYQGENTLSTQIIQEIYNEFPNVSILYVHSEQDFSLLRDVTRAGAEDFLIAPSEIDTLESRVNHFWQEQQSKMEAAVSSGSYKKGKGQIFAFYSGKGGTGKTFLSTSFAQTLKLESTAQVIHLDFNFQFGGAETYLGIESNRSLIDLKPVINELNEHHIRNVSEKEEHSKLEVLLSPRDAEMAEKVDEEFMIRLLRACKRSYDFIVVDLPSSIDEKTFNVLEEADRIYYVMTLDTPAIRVLKHVEDLFKRLGLQTEERLELILNFKGRENELTKKDLEKFIHFPVSVEIRRDIKGVQSAVNQGVPLRKATKEKKLIPPAKDIQKWVTSMLK
ncbi:pilus assembly protein CpaE [Bacillus pakistanensis]|uniref:Pilus assembly protein CpaE n=1 Tax=Rossellomorea pakistanensis TaxID=992288 RepID=A0ABS2NK60_9BACI|nr:AAA family ATPase [Bacillus pakistanensis]MBM7588255.1 pilus assembly protein CpaE [Bacillus pakistanensis]